MESHPTIEVSGAKIIDQLSGVGAGFTILFLTLGVSLFLNYIQFKQKDKLVEQMLALIPDTVKSIVKVVQEFKEAVDEFNKKN